MLQRTLGILAAVAVSLSLVAAPAGAANPKDGTYQQSKGDRSVIRLAVDGNKMVVAFYNKCSRVPVPYKVKIRKSGKFVFKGTKRNVLDEKIKIRLNGKFKTKNLAVGTVKYTAAGCSAKKVRFRAKYDASVGPIVGG